MLIASALPGSYASQINVDVPDGPDFDNFSSGVTYSGVRFGSDGVIYRATDNGAWQSSGYSWLLDGAASAHYLKRVASGDALSTTATDLAQMNANLDFVLINASTGTSKNATIVFTICADAGGVTEEAENSYFLLASRS